MSLNEIAKNTNFLTKKGKKDFRNQTNDELFREKL